MIFLCAQKTIKLTSGGLLLRFFSQNVTTQSPHEMLKWIELYIMCTYFSPRMENILQKLNPSENMGKLILHSRTRRSVLCALYFIFFLFSKPFLK